MVIILAKLSCNKTTETTIIKEDKEALRIPENMLLAINGFLMNDRVAPTNWAVRINSRFEKMDKRTVLLIKLTAIIKRNAVITNATELIFRMFSLINETNDFW